MSRVLKQKFHLGERREAKHKIWIFLALCILLTACSDHLLHPTKVEVQDGDAALDPYVTVAEGVSLPVELDQCISLREFRYRNNVLWCIREEYAESHHLDLIGFDVAHLLASGEATFVDGEGKSEIVNRYDYCYSLDAYLELPAGFAASQGTSYLAGYDVDGSGTPSLIFGYAGSRDGIGVFAARLYTLSPDGGTSQETDLLQLLRLSEIQAPEFREYYAMSDGRFFLANGNQVYLLNSNSTISDHLDLGDAFRPESVLETEDSLYFLGENLLAGERQLRKAPNPGQGGELEAGVILPGLPVSSNYLADPGDGKLLMATTGAAYLYDPGLESAEELFTWASMDCFGNDLLYFWADDAYHGVFCDYSLEHPVAELVTISRKRQSEVPLRTELTLAMLYEDQSLTRYAYEFNRSQDRWHVNLQTTYDWATTEGMTYSDARLALLDLLRTAPPDMLALDEIPGEWRDLARNGTLADLTPYLEQSEVLRPEEYPENIRNTYTEEGRMVGIPKYRTITVWIGGKDSLGEKAGWTLEQVLDLVESHPETALVDYASREYVAKQLLAFTLSRFYDPEQGVCDFISPTFQRLVEYLSTVPAEASWNTKDERSQAQKLSDGDMLLMDGNLISVTNIQEYDAYFEAQGGANFVGFPSCTGEPTMQMNTSGSVGILETCKYPEGAWEFIEFVLTQEELSGGSHGFPTNGTELDALFLKAYEDRAGEGSGVGYGNWKYEFHAVTMEEIDRMKELFGRGKVAEPFEEEVLDIILTEVGNVAEGLETSSIACENIQNSLKNR